MTKFKSSILTLIAIFVSNSIFYSCSTETINSESINNVTAQSKVAKDDTEQLKTFLNQWYDTSKTNFEVLKAEEDNQSFYMQIDSNSSDGIVEFYSETIEFTSDGTNEFFTTKTEFSNENGYTASYELKFKKLTKDQFEIVDYRVLSINGDSMAKGWFSDYGDCIGGVLDTDRSLGQVITVLGIAGGAGCVPCGIAGGVIFGFAALGCTAV